jgi:toxin-antitoxin system PIN domain toxin
MARGWMERALSSTETIGFAFVVLLAFVRIGTNPRVMRAPLEPGEALDQVGDWLAQSPASILNPGPRHLAIWREQISVSGAAGNLTTDAHLASLAIEHSATLTSFDGDFHRFGGLKLEHLR